MNARPTQPDPMPADAMSHGQAARYLGIPFRRLLELIDAGELARPLRRSELKQWRRLRAARPAVLRGGLGDDEAPRGRWMWP